MDVGEVHAANFLYHQPNARKMWALGHYELTTYAIA